MKTACLMFAMLAWAALMQGASHAAPVDPLTQQSSERSTKAVSDDDANDAAPVSGAPHHSGTKPCDEERDRRHVSDKPHTYGRATPTKASRPNQLPNRLDSTHQNTFDVHQPGSEVSRGLVRGGSIQNEAVKRVLPVRSPSMLRPVTPSLDNARHRGPNPAAIGGSASSNASNTGAINGTGMHRMP